jgi:hypothetical protein
MAAVSIVNLVIHKGTHFEETFYFTAEDGEGLNLLNSTATAKLKKHWASQTSYEFTTTLTIADSTVKVEMPDTITSTLPSGRCVYDVILTSPGEFKTKIVEGNVLVQETISV